MISKRTALLIMGGIIFSYVALITSYVQLMIMAAILILFPATVFAITGRKRISASLSSEDTSIYEDESAHITLTVKNNGSSLGYVEVFGELPKQVKLKDGNNHARMVLPNGSEKSINYSVTFPLRGRYILGPTVVRSFDPYLLFYESRAYKTPLEITVYPREEKINTIEFRALMEIKPYGISVMRKPGSGKEFHRIRQYQPSDPLKNINWKVYARRGELMVNEYEKEDVTNTYIFLDARAESGIGTAKHNPLEHMLRGVLGVSEAALAVGNKVVLASHGSSINMVKTGRVHGYQQILEFCTDLYPDGSSTLRDAIEATSHEISKRGVIFIFHTLLGDDTVKKAVQMLIAMGNTVVLITPAISPYTSESTKMMVKYHLYMTHREQTIRAINNMGGKVIVWGEHSSLSDLFVRKVILQ